MTAHAGFTTPDEPPLLTRRIAADEPFEVDVAGDLHQGVALQLGPSGFAIPVDACGAWVDNLTWDLEAERTGYVVLVPGASTSATERTGGGPARSVVLTPLTPALDVSTGRCRPSHPR